MSRATVAALPTSVWIRMYACTTRGPPVCDQQPDGTRDRRLAAGPRCRSRYRVGAGPRLFRRLRAPAGRASVVCLGYAVVDVGSRRMHRKAEEERVLVARATTTTQRGAAWAPQTPP